MIKVILFDFYGVFLPDAFESWLKKNGQKREGVFAELIEQSDKGQLGEAEFLAGLSEALGREVKSDEIHSQDPEPDTELIAFAQELKSNYKICLLSNASARLRKRLERLGIAELFDEIIISSEIGHAKPSNEAFAIAVQRTGVASEEILFVDDNPKNVEAARGNGLWASRYVSTEELRKELQKFY